MKLEQVVESIAAERIVGDWDAYLLKIISLSSTNDDSLSRYISAATNAQSLLLDELGRLSDEHPPSNDLDYVHIGIVRGNITIAFAYVYVVELWSSNYLAGIWEVTSELGLDLSKLDRIGSGRI